jgi:hypothetical protein
MLLLLLMLVLTRHMLTGIATLELDRKPGKSTSVGSPDNRCFIGGPSTK